MEISINKQSEVPVRDQLAAQLIFLIATGKLKAGDSLPSVRALARRLRIHHNTVSGAYQDLVGKDLLTRRRGSRLVVKFPDEPPKPGGAKDLDDVINDALRSAHRHGFTLRQLTLRVRERMMEEPPDHVLALSTDPGMRRLFEVELGEVLTCPVESCSPAELLANPDRAMGAAVIVPPGLLSTIHAALPKSRPPIPVVYSDAGIHLETVRQLHHPSLIAVASVSEGFLEIARGLLGPVASPTHSLVEYLLRENESALPGGADILFCDRIWYHRLYRRRKWKALVPYRLISDQCLEQVRNALAA